MYHDFWADLFPITLIDDAGIEYVFDNLGESGDIFEIPKFEYDVLEFDNIP